MSDQEQVAEERPATYAEVFDSGEFRAVFASSALSWLGDFLAKAAVTALVYTQSHSVLFSAATFAIGYLPWVLGGPVLATLADRYPYRRVMIACDGARAALIALVAVPGIPLWVMLALLFLTSLLNPPFDAARSALTARILSGDRYVVALSLQTSSRQAALLLGYGPGAALGSVQPRLALLVDAGTFLLSALLIWLGVRGREPALHPRDRTWLLRETADGFRIVFGSRVLRSVAVLIFLLALFTVAPEGLAAAWAAQLSHSPAERGFNQALIMVSTPLGQVVGGLLIGRLVAPERRRALIRPLSVLAALALVPAVMRPHAGVVAVLAGLSGFASAAPIPAAVGLFAQALPESARARAFGVMQSGTQLMQGVGVFVAGLLADRYALPVVIGVMSMVGVAALLLSALTWPGRRQLRSALDRRADPVPGAGPPDVPVPPVPEQADTAHREPTRTLRTSP